jgi:hypothetical protein
MSEREVDGCTKDIVGQSETGTQSLPLRASQQVNAPTLSLSGSLLSSSN